MLSAADEERLCVAIHDYVRACGGNPSAPSSARTAAHAVVLEVVDDIARRAVTQALSEALNSGDGTYKP